MALYLALFAVMDYAANILPFFKMPYGGTLGIGTLALLVAAYHLCWKKAVLIALASILLQFITGAMYIYHPIQFVLDYGLAFAIYGFAGIFPKYSGVVVANTVRFICHVISGVVFFAQFAGEEGPLLYSLAYNGGYMFPTMILAIIVVPIIDKRIKTTQKTSS